MGDIILNQIKVTDGEVELYKPDDPYIYTVDNRPLRNLIWNDQQLFSALSDVVDWLNRSRGVYEALPDRLDALEKEVECTNQAPFVVAENIGPFYFEFSNNVLKVKADNDKDWTTIEFDTGELTIEQVVDKINLVASTFRAYNESGKLKIQSLTSRPFSKVVVASSSEGSTANSVLGFPEDGVEVTTVLLCERVKQTEDELKAARFEKSSLSEFLSVAHLPDGTVKADAIASGVPRVDDFQLKGTSQMYLDSDVVGSVSYNVTMDSDSGTWVRSALARTLSWATEQKSGDRGSRKDFPALALVVLRQKELVIYNYTVPPNPELWMRFKIARTWESGLSFSVGDLCYINGEFYECLEEHTATADTQPGVGSNWSAVWKESKGCSLFGKPARVLAGDGVILVLMKDTGLFAIDFTLDKITWFNRDGGQYFVGNIAQRNIDGEYMDPLPELKLRGNDFRDVAMAAKELYAVSTDQGVNLINTISGAAYLLTSGTYGSSSTAVAGAERMLVFSLGSPGDERTVFVLEDVASINTDIDVDTIALHKLNENSDPALDSYQTVTLACGVIDGSRYLVAKGSKAGVKIAVLSVNPNRSYSRMFSATRDASFPMKKVRSNWTFDVEVNPDEVVDDLSQNQIPLVSKGHFIPESYGSVSLYDFDGSRYLINETQAQYFSFDGSFLVAFIFKPETLDGEYFIVGKWEEPDKREWKVEQVGTKIRLTVYDEETDGYLQGYTTNAILTTEVTYLVVCAYDAPTGVFKFFVNGIDSTGVVSSSGTFSKMRSSDGAFSVGAYLKDSVPTKFLLGKLGCLYVGEAPDMAFSIFWNSIAYKSFRSWSGGVSSRLFGDTDRVHTLDYSKCGRYIIAGTNSGLDNGAVSRILVDTASCILEQDKSSFSNGNVKTVSSCGSFKSFVNDVGYYVEVGSFNLRESMTLLGDLAAGCLASIARGTSTGIVGDVVTLRGGTYIAMDEDGLILADCSTGPCTIYLPLMVPGKSILIKKIDETDNPVVLVGGDCLIDNLPEFRIKTQYTTYRAVCDGVTWWLVAERVIPSLDLIVSDYHTTRFDDYLLVDCSSGPVTITLEAIKRQILTVKKIDSSPNPVILKSSSGTIDGFNSLKLDIRNVALKLICDGNNWWVV